MQKQTRVPTWLARRSYFKRIERWTKLDKSRRPAATEVERVAMPSNVVPFPARENRPNRPVFADLRGVSMG
jgi:hypothetical protein